jgi:sarcosine oxidase delta subunit
MTVTNWKRIQARSSKTGRWVSRMFARKNKSTTTEETISYTVSTSAGDSTPPWNSDGTWNVSSASLFVPCPYCDKLIQKGDKFCQWCQSEIDA